MTITIHDRDVELFRELLRAGYESLVQTANGAPGAGERIRKLTVLSDAIDRQTQRPAVPGVVPAEAIRHRSR